MMNTELRGRSGSWGWLCPAPCPLLLPVPQHPLGGCWKMVSGNGRVAVSPPTTPLLRALQPLLGRAGHFPQHVPALLHPGVPRTCPAVAPLPTHCGALAWPSWVPAGNPSSSSSRSVWGANSEAVGDFGILILSSLPCWQGAAAGGERKGRCWDTVHSSAREGSERGGCITGWQPRAQDAAAVPFPLP